MFTGTAFVRAADLPSDWQSWPMVKSPLNKIGALPGCDADVSTLPLIYQETVSTYCAVKPGGPGKVAVMVRPEVKDTYKQRSGNYADGVNLLLHLKDMSVLFATEHKAGQPVYHLFKESGEKIIIDQPGHPLNKDTCIECHTGFSSYCVAGQCGLER